MAPLRWFLLALLVYSGIAISLAGPAVVGLTSLTPEGFLDRDALLRPATEPAKLRPFEDPTPVVIELGRERAMALGIQEGRFDSWNPWTGAGAPLWAEQGNPFFPTKIVSFLYPSHHTLMAALAVRLVLAALGLFLLARALGLTAPIALFVGALFEYSGSAAANLPYANSSAIYMLPWVLLGAHKICNGRNGMAVAISGLALGTSLLGGHPSLAMIACLGFGAYVIGRTAQQRPTWPELLRLSGLVAAAGVIALLIAAVGLLPFFELLANGHTYKNTEASELIWRTRLAWTRGVFGTAAFFPSLITAMRDSMEYRMWPWAQGASIGFLALVLAATGARVFRSDWGIALVAILGIGLTLSPVGLQWLHALPGISFILPWYCYPLIVVPLCIAAGFGLKRLGNESCTKQLLTWLAVGLAVAACAFLVSAPIGWRIRDAFETMAGPGLLYDVFAAPVRLNTYHLGIWPTLISPIFGVSAIAAYVVGRRVGLRATLALAILALVEAAAIRIPTIGFERSNAARAEPAAATARLQTLLATGLWRFTGVPPWEAAGPNTSLLFELRDLRSFSALSVGRHTKFLELAGKPSEDASHRPQWQYPVAIQPAMLSLAAVKYVVYTKQYLDTAVIPPGLSALDSVGDVVFYENALALPRFRIAHDIVAVAGERQAFDALQDLLVQPIEGDVPEWTRRVVIEGLTPEEVSRTRINARLPHKPGIVRRVAEPDPQTIVLEANLESPGYVIVADTYYPGWTATVNGLPVKIHPANLMFRAVAVPAGKNTIVMTYQSSWLRLGMALTLVGVVIAIALLVRQRLRSRLIETSVFR